MSNKQELIEIYKSGVEEVAENEVIFIDPDSPDSVHQQMNEQVPGIGDKYDYNKLTEADMKGIDPNNMDPDSRVFKAVSTMGVEGAPYRALTNEFEFEGKNYSVVSLPSEDGLTKEAHIDAYLKSLPLSDQEKENIANNAPGTIEEYLRETGNHEGAHTNQGHSPSDNIIEARSQTSDTEYTTGPLIIETNADEVAFAKANERGEGHISDFVKDLRALRSSHDPTHASSILVGDPAKLNDDIVVTDDHFNRALYLQTDMNKYAAESQGLDPSKYDNLKQMESLREQDPDKYFEMVHEGIDKEISALNPEYSQERLEDLTTQKEYIQNYEDAYRRRVLGEDIPQRSPAIEGTPETGIETSENNAEDQVVSTGYVSQQSEYTTDNTVQIYQTTVDGMETGGVSVGEDWNMSVNGVGMSDVFAQSANPAPENISVVSDPRALPETPGVATPESTVNTQSLYALSA